MSWVRSRKGLYNFIGHVVLSAPDRFPLEDFLAADEQLNLERAFEEMRAGLRFAQGQSDSADFMSSLNSLLDQSLAAYRSGDRKRGAHLLQEFEQKIFGAKPA